MSPRPPGVSNYSVPTLFGGSLKALVGAPRALLTAAALPFALLMLRNLLLPPGGSKTGAPAPAPGQIDLSGLGDILGLVIDVAAATLFAVAWHRFLLGHGRPLLLPHPDRQHARFFWRLLGMSLFLLAPMILGSLLGVAGLEALRALLMITALWVILAVYLVLRSSLIFPAVAVGVPLTLRQSWQVTRGRLAPLFLSLLVAGFILFILSVILLQFAAALSGLPAEEEVAARPSLLVLAAGEVIFLLELAMSAGILSLAAMRLIPDPGRV